MTTSFASRSKFIIRDSTFEIASRFFMSDSGHAGLGESGLPKPCLNNSTDSITQ
jgi:hypothetical protein